jgi:maltose O-acetyltransferase
VFASTETTAHDQAAPLAGIVFGNAETLPARPPLGALRGWQRFERHLRRVVANACAGGFLVPKRLRNVLLRQAGMAVGEHVSIFSGSVFRDVNVIFSDRCFVNYRCIFDATAPVVLEPDVFVGPGVTFSTSTHELGRPPRRAGRLREAPIRVGQGTWIGTGATVLAGVTVGPGCLIAAGAVVARDCDPDGMYAGVPATRIKDLPG